MSYLDRHSYSLGAAEWGWDQYKALAIDAAQKASGTFIVALVGRNGAFTRTTAYPSRASALAAWDQVRVSFPAEVGYGLAYDKSEKDPDFRVVEEGSNPNLETVIQKKLQWKSLVPWGVAGLAVIAAASYLNRRRPSKAGKTLRMRRRPTWRKRVVTVWR